MKFMVIVKATPQSEAGVIEDPAAFEAMGKFNEEMINAGVLIAGEGLQSSAKGARLRYGKGRYEVIDGPFAETKELVAGFWIIDVRDRDDAIAWMKKYPFAEGEELWLGGVRVPHARGLSGHSDADVALHAITDALLGTIGAGDIGMHFPPSDPQWRGQRSSKFLEHAAALVAAKGGVIDFIDLTIICEAPKIGPHREAIRASIAGILGLEPSEVSVKATTTERLGFTGRGEGMAAQAIATVRVPG